MANFEEHLTEVEQQLAAQDPSSFLPELALLDEVIQSLEVDSEATGAEGPGAVATVAVAPDPYAGWETYSNAAFGYTLRYPGDCEVMGGDLDESVQFVGPLLGNEHWPWFFVDHYESDFFHPPAGTDLLQWLVDHNVAYDELAPETQVAGLDAVHLVTEASPQAYGADDYFFAKDGQLFHIQILHAGGQQDWELYDLFLQGFAFQ